MRSPAGRGRAAAAIAGLLVLPGSAYAGWTPETLPPNIVWTELDPRAIAFDDVQSWSGCHGQGARQRFFRPMDEASAIRATGRARREGGALHVGAAILRDHRFEAPDVDLAEHRYVGRYPNIELDLVHVQYWEGDGWILVDPASGSTLEMSDIPILAPDGRTFAAVSDDEAYNPHGVQIASWRGGRLSMAAEVAAMYPCDGAWRGSRRLSVRVRTETSGGAESLWVPAEVRRGWRGWRLRPR